MEMTLCQRGIGTDMSEAPVLVPFFPYAAEGGVRPSFSFGQGTESLRQKHDKT